MQTHREHRLDAALRELVLERDGARCTVARFLGGQCHRTLDVHHIIPRSEGGTDELENLATVCHAHHPLWERLRVAVLNARGPRWRRCPHRHTTRDGRESCERRLNRDAVAA